MLAAVNLKKGFAGQVVLDELSFQLNPGERIGLVGRNGAGKTTLLRLLLGDDEPDSGSIVLTPGTSLGYLTQDIELDQEGSLHDELLSVFGSILELERQQRVVESELTEAADEARVLALVERHDALQVQFESQGGYTIEAEIGKVMDGLGFQPADRDKPVGQFSGGWQMRAGLAKLLLQGPDVLLLDEPTNHLDLFAVEWLAEYLRGYKGSVFIVSHDRWLLDRVCTRILELERGKVTSWPGNYSAFLAAKAQQQELQAAAYERQQEYLTKQQAFIDRFRGKPTKTRATQSREKLLAKIERFEAPRSPERRLAFRFPSCSPSGRETMLLRRVYKAYGAQAVFADVTFTIERGDRIALIGPNGAGKTTLLRLLAREEQPDRGVVTYGHNVQLAFFTQHQADSLDVSHTPFEEVYSVAPPGWSETDVRGLLGRMLFSGDDVFKPIAVLSGGERSRVAVAKLLLRPTNVLLLDEPTNHLDIPAREVLEQALGRYEGAFVIATHDRFLLDQVTNKVVEVGGGGVTIHPVGYREFVAARGQGTGARRSGPDAGSAEAGRIGFRERVSSAPAAPPNPRRAAELEARPSGSNQRFARERLRSTEEQIEQLEGHVRELEQQLADSSLYRDPDEYQRVLHDHEDTAAQLSVLAERWEELARRVEVSS